MRLIEELQLARVYLVSPYSHPSEVVREIRYQAALQATRWLLKHGVTVFSPIVYGHTLVKGTNLGTTFEDWAYMDETLILRWASKLGHLVIDGYWESKGMKRERALKSSDLQFHMIPKSDGTYELKRGLPSDG